MKLFESQKEQGKEIGKLYLSEYYRLTPHPNLYTLLEKDSVDILETNIGSALSDLIVNQSILEEPIILGQKIQRIIQDYDCLKYRFKAEKNFITVNYADKTYPIAEFNLVPGRINNSFTNGGSSNFFKKQGIKDQSF